MTTEAAKGWAGRLRAALQSDVTWIAVALLALVLWTHTAWLHRGGFLGAPGTDVLRGAWGFDHQVRSLPLPFWTSRVGFPEGVKLLVLPTLSSVLGAPFAVFGPVIGYGAWVLALAWGTAVATAMLARTVSGSGAAGLAAGAWMAVQPMILLAITDGTPEYAAFGALPGALALMWAARQDKGWLPAAGGAALVYVALDSPYHAVFALPFLPIVLWGTSRRNLLMYAIVGLIGAGVLAGAYWGLPVGDVEDQRRGGNAVQAAVWAQWETGNTNGWDYTLAPGFVPVASIAGALLLAALRPLRSAPWVLAAALCFVFAVGENAENPNWVLRNHGEFAGSLARGIASFNESVHVPVVRFPRRWLVPMAMGLGVAASIGLSRLPWRPARILIALPVGAAAVWQCFALTHYRTDLPTFAAPTAAFATFIRGHDADGAILALPTIRGSKTAATRREDIPIWANLDDAIRSADQLWIQLATGRASVYIPLGMRTMERRTAREKELETLLRDLDDLTIPQTMGNPIPPSATQEPERRATAAAALVAKGLSFVALDEALYATEGIALAKQVFASHIVEERHFDDGSGVTVWVVE